jgi:hypothetical protein
VRGSIVGAVSPSAAGANICLYASKGGREIRRTTPSGSRAVVTRDQPRARSRALIGQCLDPGRGASYPYPISCAHSSLGTGPAVQRVWAHPRRLGFSPWTVAVQGVPAGVHAAPR